jgi:hypothetical protein
MKLFAIQSLPGPATLTVLADSCNLILSLIHFYYKLAVIGVISELEVLKE